MASAKTSLPTPVSPRSSTRRAGGRHLVDLREYAPDRHTVRDNRLVRMNGRFAPRHRVFATGLLAVPFHRANPRVEARALARAGERLAHDGGEEGEAVDDLARPWSLGARIDDQRPTRVVDVQRDTGAGSRAEPVHRFAIRPTRQVNEGDGAHCLTVARFCHRPGE